jgi:hypothetical protein
MKKIFLTLIYTPYEVTLTGGQPIKCYQLTLDETEVGDFIEHPDVQAKTAEFRCKKFYLNVHFCVEGSRAVGNKTYLIQKASEEDTFDYTYHNVFVCVTAYLQRLQKQFLATQKQELQTA